MPRKKAGGDEESREIAGIQRPYPPQDLDGYAQFYPDPALRAWIATMILSPEGRLYNPDHAHIDGDEIGFMWASQSVTKKSRTIIGECEELVFRMGGWQKQRAERQFYEWFPDEFLDLPKFMITLAADYCRECSDSEFCALVEHELYHIGHKLNALGDPMYDRDGKAILGIQGHDVEEFIGVVRRYGAGSPGGSVAQLVDAAKQIPEVSTASIAHACGACLRRVA